MITYRQLGRNGRLGNQLWQIASTIGIAHRRDETAGFPFWRYQSYFSVPSTLFPDLIAVESEDLGLDYLQDLRHLIGVEAIIREYFKPNPDVWLRLARRFRELLAIPHKTAVHVRRGDYLVHSDLFPPLPLEYYIEAMGLTQGPYLVFSDDTQWCRENLPGDCVFLEHNRDYEDLFLMAACDEVITANSTYSWWAAWLANTRAIYPRQWGTGFGYEAETMVIPPGSVVLDAGPS
jgi:Glycosyl transferase family 11